MINVEDLVKGLNLLIKSTRISDAWFVSFLPSVLGHINTGNSLSSNQSNVICKCAANNVRDLSKVLRVSDSDIIACINNPTYKNTPYRSLDAKREVRYAGRNFIVFRFKVDNTVIADLKRLSSGDISDSKLKYIRQYRLWRLGITSENINEVQALIQRHRFDFDQQLLEYMLVCQNSSKVKNTVVVTDDQIIINSVNTVLTGLVENILGGRVF